MSPTHHIAIVLLALGLAACSAPAASPTPAPTAAPQPTATQAAPAGPALPKLPDPVAVELDAKTTAYLVLDIAETTCSAAANCPPTVPAIAALLKKARDAGVPVIYSLGTAPTNVLPQVAPQGDEPIVRSRANKFGNTNLDELLKARGVKTLLLVGTAANGAVLYTAFEANAFRGYTVVVAEDGISAGDPFAVLLTRWQLLNQPGLGNPENKPLQPNAVTLTRSDSVTFK